MLDKDKILKTVDAKIAQTTNPRHLRNLQVTRDHLALESASDYDNIMRTMGRNPEYHVWGAPDFLSPKTFEGVHAFYKHRFTTNRVWFQYDVEKLAVDDDVIFMEGVFKFVIPAFVIAQPGGWPVGGVAIDDPGDWYLVETRMVMIWPFDEDGLLAGEDSYAHPLSHRKLSAQEVTQIPAYVKATVNRAVA